MQTVAELEQHPKLICVIRFRNFCWHLVSLPWVPFG